MPNWVTNHLTIEAENEERLHEILTAIAYDDKGLGTIDFNKINPMPENIFRGDLGPKERELYGETNWYAWSVKNWATKWNSTPMLEPHEYDGGNRVSFLTAWSPPEPVIVRLSEMYPDARFCHAWANDDIGIGVGEITYAGGEQIEYDVPTGSSKEAYEMAADIMGIELADYDLHYDEATGNYVYRDDEDETVSAADLHTSPDFQSDQTEGFPASLCWDMNRGVAWLSPNESLADDDTDLAHYEQLCADFGNRPCADRDEFNALLEELGDDAVESAWLPDEDENEEFGGMSLS